MKRQLFLETKHPNSIEALNKLVVYFVFKIVSINPQIDSSKYHLSKKNTPRKHTKQVYMKSHSRQCSSKKLSIKCKLNQRPQPHGDKTQKNIHLGSPKTTNNGGTDQPHEQCTSVPSSTQSIERFSSIEAQLTAR